MQQKNANMFAVRQQLQVDSIGMKFDKRHLIRMGHIFRMDNSRLTKQITLGWPSEKIKNLHKKAHQTTVGYWRKLLRESGQDPDMNENHVTDRKKYRNFVSDHIKDIAEWENARQRESLNQGTSNQRTFRSGVQSVNKCAKVWHASKLTLQDCTDLADKKRLIAQNLLNV